MAFKITKICVNVPAEFKCYNPPSTVLCDVKIVFECCSLFYLGTCNNFFAFFDLPNVLIIGVIYIFMFFNAKEEKTRYKYLLYYSFCLIENTAIIIIWFLSPSTSLTSW